MIAYLRPAARYKAGSLSKKEIEGCKNDPQWRRAVEKAGGIRKLNKVLTKVVLKSL